MGAGQFRTSIRTLLRLSLWLRYGASCLWLLSICSGPGSSGASRNQEMRNPQESPGRPVTDRRYDIIAGMFCVGALVVALVAGHFHRVGTFGVETDFYPYAIEAQSLLEGRAFTPQYNHDPRGYILVLTGVASLIGDTFVAAKALTAFATAAFGWLAYLLLKALFDRRVALCGAVLSLLVLVPYSFLAATDMLGSVPIMLSLWVLLRRPAVTFPACFLAGV